MWPEECSQNWRGFWLTDNTSSRRIILILVFIFVSNLRLSKNMDVCPHHPNCVWDLVFTDSHDSQAAQTNTAAISPLICLEKNNKKSRKMQRRRKFSKTGRLSGLLPKHNSWAQQTHKRRSQTSVNFHRKHFSSSKLRLWARSWQDGSSLEAWL